MSMLNISFRAAPETIEAFKRKGGQIISVLASRLNFLIFALGRYVQEEKLSGEVLVPRSGRLRASVTAHETTVQGTRLTASVSAADSVSFYGVIQERGIPSPYTIISSKQRFLKFLMDGREHFATSISRKPTLPRPFMESSLTENKTQIVESLQQALRDVVNEK